MGLRSGDMDNLSIQQLKNICAFFLQLEERMIADCYPNIAVHARRQYLKYNDQLEMLKFENFGSYLMYLFKERN